ncbi:efflux RND transporter periplasmic adaptor subunit [Vogesella indigofera]|uniref:efflux RND transporter periplasmic adaptor subunit n=1 Tax=Vogesella indigofera TaxID=45465 RepID=UPI00234E6C42|nr:efflux RND transporter periplasmic adaptor subunit [Vogesella indigofera]MDC7706159.1 efflux RND transporter periplasmic adaptor subunit [Vogesella indigofera]
MSSFNNHKWTLALLPLAVMLTACGQQGEQGEQAAGHGAMPPMPVSVVKMAAADVPVVTEYVGQAVGSREVEVRARVSGILQKRAYTEGASVRAGDVLFQLDAAPYQAALEQAEATLKLEEAKLIRAQQDHDRVLPLFKENAVSQKDRDDAVAALASAKASVAAARAAMKSAQINLGYTRVTAPISGVTSAEARSEGSLVQPGDAGLLTKISQLDPIYVKFSLSDNDVLKNQQLAASGKLRQPEGGRYIVSLKLPDGSTYGREGRINFADRVIDPTTGTSAARASFVNPEGTVRAGQFVRVELKGSVRLNALVVPQKAVLTSQQGKMVWVVGKDNTVEARPLQISDSANNGFIVESGLKAGDLVITDNLIKLRPGAKVVPQAAAANVAAPAAAQG